MTSLSNLLSRIEDQKEALILHLDSLSNEKRLETIFPSKWSIHDNFAHLVRYQENFINRIQNILEDSNPSIPRYKAENDIGFAPFLEMSYVELKEGYVRDRKEFYDLIKNLKPDQLKKTGSHPKFGKMSIPEWIEFFILHEAHHMYTIFRLARLN